jgi:hypothetical protein
MQYDSHIKELIYLTERYWYLVAGAAMRTFGHEQEAGELNYLQQVLLGMALNIHTRLIRP